MTSNLLESPIARHVAIAAALALLSLITGFSQIKTEGLAWQEAHYGPRLEAVLQGEAPAPDQYRVLSDGLAALAVRAATSLGLPRPMGLTFVALRLLQNLAIFVAAYAFYRSLGIRAYTAVIGLSALAWGMTQSNYGSTLAFSAYSDMLLYLCAAMALLHERYRLIIPITILAALNRESSLLIPVMALACAVRFTPRLALVPAIAHPACLALAAYVMVLAALRLYFMEDVPREWAAHASGATPGLSFLLYNLGNDAAWSHAFGALGIIPVLALMSWRGWHPLLRPLFWSVAPVWCLAALFCAPLDQSRVLLLPQVLVFIPGVLCGLTGLVPRDSATPVRVPVPRHAERMQRHPRAGGISPLSPWTELTPLPPGNRGCIQQSRLKAHESALPNRVARRGLSLEAHGRFGEARAKGGSA